MTLRNPQSNINRRRLRKLAGFLDHDIKDDWFDLNVIADPGFDKRKCGTAACAIGWTPSCFPRSGIELRAVEPAFAGDCDLEVWFKGLEGFAAAESFYGLDDGEACFLFEPSEYPHGKRSRHDVAKRIRDFCDGEVAP